MFFKSGLTLRTMHYEKQHVPGKINELIAFWVSEAEMRKQHIGTRGIPSGRNQRVENEFILQNKDSNFG